MNIPEMEAVCKQVRRDIITMTAAAGSGHPGGSLSATEILVALYYDLMKVDPKNPNDPARDRLVLSKGHAAPALYAVLGEKGFFDKKEFANFRQLHSILQGHPDTQKVPRRGRFYRLSGSGRVHCGRHGAGREAHRQPLPRVRRAAATANCRKASYGRRPMSAAHYKLDNLTVHRG